MLRISLTSSLALALACGGPAPSPSYADRAQVLARVTGPGAPMASCPEGFRIPSANATSERWRVAGTDLGIAWENGRGEIAVVFGDTFDGVDTTDPAIAYGDHRRNVLGFSTDRTPDDGITITRMIEDRPGHAGEIVGATRGVAAEPSVIPTAGIAIGARNYLFFMSVKSWDPDFVWTTNFSSIAYSDDFGERWTRSTARWPGESRFAQAGLAVDGAYLYVLGTP